MSVHGIRVNVVGAATPLNAADAEDNRAGKTLVVRNRSTSILDLGGSDVTTGNGFQLDVGDNITVELEEGETVYAVGPSAGPFRVDVLRLGVA